MYEEHRLMALGFPLEDAISLCYSLRKEGTLHEFIENEEKKFRERLCQCAEKAENFS